MGIGGSLFLIAVGAILAFAVEVETEGFNLNTIGIILMIVGVVGILLSMMFWSSWGGFNRTDRTVVRDREVRDRDVI
jgi:hypothetical protein